MIEEETKRKKRERRKEEEEEEKRKRSTSSCLRFDPFRLLFVKRKPIKNEASSSESRRREKGLEREEN